MPKINKKSVTKEIVIREEITVTTPCKDECKIDYGIFLMHPDWTFCPVCGERVTWEDAKIVTAAENGV